MINALLNNLFLFIDRVTNWLKWSKIAILSHFLSSDFICIIIVTIEKKDKKKTIVKINPRTTEDDYNIQNKINNAKIPAPVDRKAPVD